MNTIDPTKPLESEAEQQENNNSTKPLRGFAAHPENINRRGAPKRDWTFKGELEKALAQAADDGRSYKEVLMQALIKEGISGNVQATKEIMNRLDGMPVQKQEIEAHGSWIVNLNRNNA